MPEMNPMDNEAAAKPGESNYETMFRWFRAIRIYEAIYSKKSLHFEKWHSRGANAVIVLTLCSGIIASLPTQVLSVAQTHQKYPCRFSRFLFPKSNRCR